MTVEQRLQALTDAAPEVTVSEARKRRIWRAISETQPGTAAFIRQVLKPTDQGGFNARVTHIEAGGECWEPEN